MNTPCPHCGTRESILIPNFFRLTARDKIIDPEKNIPRWVPKFGFHIFSYCAACKRHIKAIGQTEQMLDDLNDELLTKLTV